MACILIADRNPHVREFLKRELADEGYCIHVAGSSSEVIQSAYAGNAIDVIVLDPDLPGDINPELIRTLRSRVPEIPVIIHTFSQNMRTGNQFTGKEIFVEKQASSIEQLKKVIHGILQQPM